VSVHTAGEAQVTHHDIRTEGQGFRQPCLAGGCDIDSFFNNNQIVFDTTFCGDWAGNVWNSDPVCGPKAPTCQSFVQNNPSEFADAYWTVNSLKVYQDTDEGNAPFSVASVAPTSTVSVASGIPPPVATSAIPTTDFSQGGNGRHTKTFGTANFVAVSSSDAASATYAPAPVNVVVDADGTVGEASVTTASVSPPEMASATASAPGSGGYPKEKRNAAPEAAAFISVETEKVKSHLLTHRHKHANAHRHLFKHGIGMKDE